MVLPPFFSRLVSSRLFFPLPPIILFWLYVRAVRVYPCERKKKEREQKIIMEKGEPEQLDPAIVAKAKLELARELDTSKLKKNQGGIPHVDVINIGNMGVTSAVIDNDLNHVQTVKNQIKILMSEKACGILDIDFRKQTFELQQAN